MNRFDPVKKPIYLEIKEEVLARIERQGLGIGDELENIESDLIDEYGASRGTVRRALSELESEGYIVRQAGRGTFVRRLTAAPLLNKALGDIVSFSEQLRQAGLPARTVILDKGTVPAGEAEGGRVQEAFGISPEEAVIRLRRLRYGGDRPYCIQTVFLLPRQCPGFWELGDARYLHLFELYQKVYNRYVTRAHEVLRVAEATDDDAKLLKVRVGAPLAIRDRISFDQTGAPWEVLHSRDVNFEYRYVILNDVTAVPHEKP